MTDILSPEQIAAALEHKRAARRRFLVGASQAGFAAGGLALLSACGGSSNTATPTPTDSSTPTPSPSATSVIIDQDAINFLANLEYLTAQFYALASGGAGISSTLLTGSGTQGAVTGGRAVTFTDPLVAQYARELAADDLAHVGFLRSILGGVIIAQPAINIDGGATGAFTTAMRGAGVIGATATFDPYASDENFLLAAFFLSDVVVTAYKGATLLLTDPVRLPAIAGIFAAEAYHAGLIRTVLYAKGATNASLRTNAGLISDYRDSLDGATDDDQGITGTGSASNITLADANGFAYTRTAGQALNIFYLTHTAVVGGGFFPAGLNGNTRTSAAN